MTDVKKNKETLKKLIKSLVTTFNGEMDRLYSSISNQLRINDIENQIKLIIEENFNKILYLLVSYNYLYTTEII